MYKKFHDLLGSRIRAIRKAKKLSQEKLAARCGMSINEIGRIERAERSPSLNTLLCICEGLEVPILELIAGIPEIAQIGSNNVNSEQDSREMIEKIVTLLESQPKKRQRLFYKILFEIIYNDE